MTFYPFFPAALGPFCPAPAGPFLPGTNIGKRGWLLTDVGDYIFGLHRITLSNVLSAEGEDDLHIHTENTVYHLTRIASKGE